MGFAVVQTLYRLNGMDEITPVELAIEFLSENIAATPSRERRAKLMAQHNHSEFNKSLKKWVSELKEPLFSDEDIEMFKASTPESIRFCKKFAIRDEYYDWLYMKEVATLLMGRGEALPPDVANYAMAYLNDEVKKPSHAKHNKDGEALQVAVAVALLSRIYGISPTRNDEPSRKKENPYNSACDYVSKACECIEGINSSSYTTVKRAWLEHKYEAEILAICREQMS